MALQRDDKRALDGRQRVNAQIGLRVPIDVIEKKRAYYMRKGKPTPRPAMMHDDDYSIMSRYQEEYRGPCSITFLPSMCAGSTGFIGSWKDHSCAPWRLNTNQPSGNKTASTKRPLKRPQAR
ncbi:MAG TPA: hypothetical protein VFV38_51440 [Ktedonobacteraceae bacterium]|nr:hypothetical protein [Ktedonobacteraceae bacterium]